MPKGICLLEEAIWLYSILLLMRSTIIVVTNVPSPLIKCRGQKILGEATQIGHATMCFCNDLMFSEHNIINLLVTFLKKVAKEVITYN